MDRIEDTLDQELIDLGAASVETRGSPILYGEADGGLGAGVLADE